MKPLQILALLVALSGCRGRDVSLQRPAARAEVWIPGPEIRLKWEQWAPDFYVVILSVQPEPTPPWHFERSEDLIHWQPLPDFWRQQATGTPYIVSREAKDTDGPFQRPRHRFYRVVCEP